MKVESVLFKSNDDRVPRGLARYGVADWDRKLGNHRALVRVSDATDAVCAYLPWRRRDAHPEAKHVMVVDARTDEAVVNTVVATCNKEYGEVVFEPVSGAGDYYLYYLVPEEDRYGETWPRSSFPIVRYKRPQNRPSEAWLEKHGLTRQALESTPPPGGWFRKDRPVYPAPWRELPLAELVEFQARGERHSFYPMELVATLDEVNALEHTCRFQPFILFPELRSNPIRMTDAVPHCWAVRDETALTTLRDTVMRNEYYVFQVGVYASKRLLKNLSVTYTDLESESGDVIPAGACTCFNLEGVDQSGSEFAKTVDVEYRGIKALWFGVDVARETRPGTYKGTVTVQAEGEAPQSVSLTLAIRDEVIEDRGDGDHWRQSRLRWLNSRMALDDDVCAPFTPVVVRDSRVEILGRRIELDDTGMLRQATSFLDMFDIREQGEDVLRGPVRFEVLAGGRTLELGGGNLECSYTSPGVARFSSTASAGRLSIRAETTVEMDGFVGHKVTLESDQPVSVDAVRLTVPFAEKTSRYFMHLADMTIDQVSHSCDFGETSDDEWTYPLEAFELLWMGAYNAGLCLRLPPAQHGWINGGKGRVIRTGAEEGRDIVLDTGPMVVEGATRLAFELYATPFKPLTREHWGRRYYHESYGNEPSVEKGQDAGASVFAYHQGNRMNPHISYPFLVADKLKQVADRIHAAGGLMTAYYTIRELSDRAPELWALRSLGNEVLMASDAKPGYLDYHLGYEDLSQLPMEYQLRNQVAWPYTGYPWMCEHLVSGYHARWHSTVDMGDRRLIDASLQISGGSRWSNFYVEGLKWLMENAGMDGIYLDGMTFDRESFKRVRKALVRSKPEGLIDYHSHPTAIGQLPYFDRLWNGEGADYDREPAYWLVAVSGVPFGVGGELLQTRASVQRGMVFGVSQRYAWASLERVDPSALWRWWDGFDIAGAEMVGFWQEGCPVATNHDAVKATAYVHKGQRVAIAVASWAADPVDVRIDLDWAAVDLDPEGVTVSIPEIAFFQKALSPVSLESVPVEPGKGWIIVVNRAP